MGSTKRVLSCLLLLLAGRCNSSPVQDASPAATLLSEAWVLSDSATENVNNNEVAVENNSKPKNETVIGDDDDFQYPTTPVPIPEGETVPPPLPSLEHDPIPSNRIINRVLAGRANCNCGIPNKRIVGGEDASISDFPWTAALLRKGKGKGPYCGGTLINDRYVVTASHCVDGFEAERIEVWLNEENFLSDNETTTIMRNVESILMHPQYDSQNIDNDIALLKLSEPVDIGGLLVPACIPADNNNQYEGYEATVVGWGAKSQGGPVSPQLQKVTVPIISNSACNWKTVYVGRITDNMLCAGELASGGKDSCQGDSGGPLVITEGDPESTTVQSVKTLAGIVSYGYGCARPLAPGVYTRVSRYPEWIFANTKDGEYCSNQPMTS